MTKITAVKKSDIAEFKTQLKAYKKAIDDDISVYNKHVQKVTLQQFGAEARLEVDAFLSILGRGGKRIRGSLVMLGYEMSGGKDTEMILQAARAIEMLHAYILIIDDIQDRSIIRRGGPTANVMLADYHREHRLADQADHFGISIALNSSMGGAHAAQMILANMNVDQELRLKVLSIVNRTMLTTTHGQTLDIMNEVVGDVTDEALEQVMEWKTAHYTVLNPLHVGMVLAGADCVATDAITTYAKHTGKVFQITDDIIGTFGSEAASGKSPFNDIREGKRTFLTVYALRHADSGDKNFLIHMLGNQQLTPAEFSRCKDILVETGALAYAQEHAKHHAALALSSLEAETGRWSLDGVHFLRGLAGYLLERQA
ncbi:MAG: polyprenyl synthetase family protein [Patescibacteria group bacterium]